MLDGSMGELNDAQRETLKGIYQNIESLNEFSRAMLYVYELEKDLPMLSCQELTLGTVTARVTKNLHNLIGEKKARVFVQSGKSDIAFTADPDLAFTILRTFVENALRYSPKGAEISASADQNEQGTTIAITDRGCGIAMEYHEYIGRKFFRAPEAKRLWTDGVGLNLYIAKNLAERTGGKISFTSDKGKGSAFRWWIPAHKQRRQPWEGRGGFSLF